MALIPPKAPNLLISPPVEYDSRFFEQLNNALRLYFSQIDNFSQGVNVPINGTTASRPITFLQIGQFYFDTTLGYPVYWNGTNWVDGGGTVR